MVMKKKLSKNQSLFLLDSLKIPCFTKIQWSTSLPFLNKKKSPMFKSNLNGDKNYVI